MNRIKIEEEDLARIVPNWTEYAEIGPSEFYLELNPDGSRKVRARVTYNYDIDLSEEAVT